MATTREWSEPEPGDPLGLSRRRNPSLELVAFRHQSAEPSLHPHPDERQPLRQSATLPAWLTRRCARPVATRRSARPRRQSRCGSRAWHLFALASGWSLGACWVWDGLWSQSGRDVCSWAQWRRALPGVWTFIRNVTPNVSRIPARGLCLTHRSAATRANMPMASSRRSCEP